MRGGANEGQPGPERIRQIAELFHAARECDAAERAALLQQRCGKDQNLLREVSSLLETEDSHGPLETPALELAAPLLWELPEASVVPGKMLGPYETLERIGAGGMSEVFRARDTRLDRHVAIKVVETVLGGNSLEEARAIAAMNHPNICTLYDIGPNYLVLELLEGETLAERLKRGPLPFHEVVNYGARIADALWAAHRKGITHGDLKPGNLMLTRDGIKVLDFGLARFKAARDPASPAVPAVAAVPILGTPAYMSPEQATEKPVDRRTDIFALGLVLFEMYTGRRAFTGSTRAELAEAVVCGEPALEMLSPAAFAHVVERCLAKDPENRWQTARDVKLELDYLARVPAAGAAKRKPARHGRWWLAAAVAAGLVAAVVFSRTPADVSITPLTSYPGSEDSPTFSPDGSRVAFSWDGAEGSNRDIYVKQIGPGEPIRLTTDSAADGSPRWSPDGAWIAFLRRGGSQSVGIYLVPALGGAEKKVGQTDDPEGVTGGSPGVRWECLDWSGDGRWLVISNRQSSASGIGLALLSVETGEIRQLTHPASTQADYMARFAPDTRSVAFLREKEGVMIQALGPGLTTNGNPRKLQVEGTGTVRSLAWSADSNDLILAAGFWQTSWLWRISAAGGSSVKRLNWGEGATKVDVARHRDLIAFSRYDGEWHIWSLTLNRAGEAVGPATRTFASSRSEVSPAFSPDGDKVAFGSNRSGNDEIWTCRSDSANCSQVTELKGPHVGSPAWSPDGKWIAFDASLPGDFDIYVVRESGGKARRLAAGLVPRWSQDGQWIYYRCAVGNQMCRIAATGGNPMQLGEGIYPQESPDGKWLYHLAGAGGRDRLFSLQRKLLTDSGAADETLPVMMGRDFAVSATGVWYLSAATREASTLSFYDFAAGTSRVVYEAPLPHHAGLAVTGDGRRVLFTQIERSPNLDLMLGEGFR